MKIRKPFKDKELQLVLLADSCVHSILYITGNH